MNERKIGHLLGVSLGPGDPDLITRGAWAALNGQSVWSWPVKKEAADSYALDITQRAGLPAPGPDGLALVFPMTRHPETLVAAWQVAAERVLTPLRAGQDVLFLCEGDASTYSTFGHLARTVQALEPSITVRVIAGVSSPQASAAALAHPLVEQDETLAILPAGYGVEIVEPLLEQFDRLALLKVNPVLDELIDLLERKALLPHARFIERAGAPDQRIVKEVGTLRGQKVHYLSLLLVHNPHRLRPPLAKSGCRKG